MFTVGRGGHRLGGEPAQALPLQDLLQRLARLQVQVALGEGDLDPRLREGGLDPQQELGPDLRLQSGDIVAVWATPGILVFGTEVIGEEVTDDAALSVDLSSAELVVTNKELEGQTLADLVSSRLWSV